MRQLARKRNNSAFTYRNNQRRNVRCFVPWAYGQVRSRVFVAPTRLFHQEAEQNQWTQQSRNGRCRRSLQVPLPWLSEPRGYAMSHMCDHGMLASVFYYMLSSLSLVWGAGANQHSPDSMSSKFAIQFVFSLQEFPDSHFCSQACFKANFATHKPLHAGRYDFDRAFDRGPNHYSKAWWKLSSIGFNAFWAHVCNKEIDQEIIEKAVGVCHNVRVMLSSHRRFVVDFVGQPSCLIAIRQLCESKTMAHITIAGKKKLTTALSAFSAVYKKLPTTERKVVITSLVLAIVCALFAYFGYCATPMCR